MIRQGEREATQSVEQFSDKRQNFGNAAEISGWSCVTPVPPAAVTLGNRGPIPGSRPEPRPGPERLLPQLLCLRFMQRVKR